MQEWISGGNLFRHDLSVPMNDQVDRARLYVVGMGYYEAVINGVKVGDQVLPPTPLTCALLLPLSIQLLWYSLSVKTLYYLGVWGWSTGSGHVHDFPGSHYLRYLRCHAHAGQWG